MWIEEYRAKNNIELDEFARRVNIVGRKMKPPLTCTVSDTLIYYLECGVYKKTHPMIADAIATVCGATKDQRNMIVDKKHWESCGALNNPFSWADEPMVKPKPNELDYSVVMVDRNGVILHRYGSAGIASRFGDISTDSIRMRCNHKIRFEFTEERQYTYRYARQWDKMTREEKLRDLGVEINGIQENIQENAEENEQ